MEQKSQEMPACLVMGCGHSGTSILIRILSAHSQLEVLAGESGIFLGDDEALIQEFINKTVAQCRSHGKKMWVEKTPNHIRVIEKIFSWLPQAKIVLMLRDPRDTACSLRARYVDTPEPEQKFRRGLMRWINDNSKALPWLGDPRLQFVRLEELVADPQTQVEQLLRRLEVTQENLLDYHARPVDWYSKTVVQEKPENGIGDAHVKLRNWQINQPLFSNTRRYHDEMTDQDWLIYNELKAEHQPVFKALGFA